MSGRHVLVTGGAGFIGSHLVELLLASGDRVTVVDDLSTGTRDNLANVLAHPNFELVVADVVAPIQVDSAPTHLVHLAAQVSVTASVANPLRDLEQNLVATLRVIEYARAVGARRVVFASSAATYGDGPLPSHEGLAMQPASPYGIHKLASEHHLRAATLAHGLPTTSLRFFNVYGPRQSPSNPYAGVISIFLARALSGEPLTLFGAGVATRDFVYVKDLVRAIAAALDGGPGRGEAYNVGTASATSVRALAETIVRVTNSASAVLDAPARAGEALHSRADVARIAADLGWQATTSLDDGLTETAGWLKSTRAPPNAVGSV